MLYCEYDIVIIRSTWVWRGMKYNNDIMTCTIICEIFVENGSSFRVALLDREKLLSRLKRDVVQQIQRN